MWVIRKDGSGTYSKEITLDYIPPDKKRNYKYGSKGEKLCKQILENTFRKPFVKIRPSFLKNEKSGRAMEIDLYNEELQLAVEYSGAQHYYYNPHFHKNRQEFVDQQHRDKLKQKILRERGIVLIVVPYDLQYEEIEPYLLNQLKEYNYI